MKKTTLYSYAVKTDGAFSYVTEPASKTPLVMVQGDALETPMLAAGLLRDLAAWAIEQAEIIEELETGARPAREPFRPYRAELVPAD